MSFWDTLVPPLVMGTRYMAIYSQCVLLLCSRHAETIIANNDGVDAASTAAVTDQCQSEKHQLVVATSKPPEKQSGSVVTPRWEHKRTLESLFKTFSSLFFAH